MFFLTLSNIDVQFAKKKLTWRIYTTKKALPTICRVELIDQQKFTKTALNGNIEAFVMHISFLGSRLTIHPAREAQIALLLAKKVIISDEYSDFAVVFLEKLANLRLEQTKINKHAIKLEDGKEPPFGLIYNLRLVELETFKTYIKTNLANGFIWALKLLADVLILVVHKPNSSLYLYVNYWGLNNLTIKNQYLLSLIDKFLNWLGQAKQFTQLDLTSAYH